MVMEFAFFLFIVGRGSGSCRGSLGADVGTEIFNQYSEKPARRGCILGKVDT